MKGELTYEKWLKLTKKEEQEMLANAQEAIERLKEQTDDTKDYKKDIPR